MTEMIDRVARAMCFKLEELVSQRSAGKDNFKDEYETLARVAIEAMREPTAEMVVAGLKCEHIDLASEWRAMIDCAVTLADKAIPRTTANITS